MTGDNPKLVFRVELDLDGALLLRRALDRESRVMGDDGVRRRSGVMETVRALDLLIARLSVDADSQVVGGWCDRGQDAMNVDEVRAMYDEPPGVAIPRFTSFTRECVGALITEINRLKAHLSAAVGIERGDRVMGSRVYIAGPYSKGDQADNVYKAVKAADLLLAAGFTPFVPHLTHLWSLLSPKKYADWIAYDLEWLPCCRYLVRLPGESPGSDGEVRRAVELGIPVYHGVEAFLTAVREGELP